MTTTPQPFQQLQSLKFYATNMGSRTFLPCLPMLESLKLDIEEEPCDSSWRLRPEITLGLSSIAHCTRLQILKICILGIGDASITTQSLLDLAGSCQRLEYLSLRQALMVFPIKALAITETEFEVVVSLLPNLRKIDDQLDSYLSTQSLLSLAKHCPSLEELKLRGSLDLSLLRFADQILSHSLQEMKLKRFIPGGNSSADINGAIIYHHAPKLWEMCAGSTPFDKAVEKDHQHLRKKPTTLVIQNVKELRANQRALETRRTVS